MGFFNTYTMSTTSGQPVYSPDSPWDATITVYSPESTALFIISSLKPYKFHGDLIHELWSSIMNIHKQYGVYFESQRSHIIFFKICLVIMEVWTIDLQILRQITHQCAILPAYHFTFNFFIY